jgi:hypothetical protein
MPTFRTASRGADGGAGFPVNFTPVTDEDLQPDGLQHVLVCEGPSCPFPGPEPGTVEDLHDDVTYVQDEGGLVILDRSMLAATSCNEACTVCVQEFIKYDCKYNCILEGERADRAARDVCRKRIDRVESCMFEQADEDAAPGNSGYVISHVRVVPGTPFHFDSKSGAYVSDEDK